MRLFLRLLAQLVTVSMVAVVGSVSVGAVHWNVPLTLVLGGATAVLTVLAYAWVVRRTEHRAPVEVAVQGAGAALGRGMLIGFGMFAAVILTIAVLGGYRIDGWGSLPGALALLGVTAAGAVTEELVFRGVLFRIVEERLGTFLALALTALLFGLAHMLNPHATVWSGLAIAVEAGGMLGAAYAATRTLWVPIGLHFAWNFADGGMLGAAYAATRTLWVPIGLHFAWNFAEGGIFGTDVSGKSGPDGLLHGVLSGSTTLSGGEFGPEASVYALLAGVLVTTVFLALARRRGHLVPLRRRAAAVQATATLSR